MACRVWHGSEYLFPKCRHAHLCFCCTKFVCVRSLCVLLLFQLSFSPHFGSLTDSAFVCVQEFTQGCGVSLRLLALHCGNTAIARCDHSCHLVPNPNWRHSEGAEPLSEWIMTQQTAFIFSPQSLRQQNRYNVKLLVPFGSWRCQRAWSGAWSRYSQGSRRATINFDHYCLQKWIYAWTQTPFQVFWFLLFLYCFSFAHRGPKNSIYFTTNSNGSCSE